MSVHASVPNFMKTTTAVIAILASVALARAMPTQVRIEVSYAGVDPAFLKDVSDVKDVFDVETSEFKMPTVTTKAGRKAVINIIREIAVSEFKMPAATTKSGSEADFVTTISENDLTAKMNQNGVRDCGAIMEITPWIKGHEIEFTGKNILRHAEPSEQGGPVKEITFTSRETFLSGSVKDGQTVRIKTGGSSKEEIVLKLTLIDAEGKPAYPAK